MQVDWPGLIVSLVPRHNKCSETRRLEPGETVRLLLQRVTPPW